MKHDKELPAGPNHDLMRALQSARTRLAVAIASEAKSTPFDKRRRYFRTELKLRRCLKTLRTLQQQLSGVPAWIDALHGVRSVELLRSVSRSSSEAHRMCRQLWEIASAIEKELRSSIRN